MVQEYKSSDLDLFDKIDTSNPKDVFLKNKSKKTIESKWNCTMQKMHKHHIIDFMAIVDKKASAWIEVKCLNKTFNQYPYSILSYSKYMKGVEYHNVSGLPFIFATRLQDGDYYYKYESEHKFDIIWGGRTKQTRDKFDIEPIVLIPKEYFKEIK